MENKPILKTKKMTITNVIEKNYRNVPLQPRKKTNPFQTKFYKFPILTKRLQNVTHPAKAFHLNLKC